MDPATTDARRNPAEAVQGRRRWLQSDEGWTPSEDVARIAAAVGIAVGAVALKFVVVGVLGGELGYPSYLGAVAVGAWDGHLRARAGDPVRQRERHCRRSLSRPRRP